MLCVSDEMFDTYTGAAEGQFAGRHIAITSREPSSELRHAGKRFILSMPEYVAGLQFDTVFLIHVDAAEAPINSGTGCGGASSQMSTLGPAGLNAYST